MNRLKLRFVVSSVLSKKTGLLIELRAREFYEKPTAERKRKLAAAVKKRHHAHLQ